MPNRRCSVPAAHGLDSVRSRPPAPPLTQLQVDAIRDQIPGFAAEVATWHELEERQIQSVCWLFFFHLCFTLAEDDLRMDRGLSREDQQRLLDWWNATRALREASDG